MRRLRATSYRRVASPRVQEAAHDLRTRRRSLRAHDVQPLRPQRAAAAGCLAGSVAELRRRPAARDAAAQSCGGRSTSASRTSTWPTTTGRPTARPRRRSERLLRTDLAPFRDELVISTKAGYDMWPGPYGDFGSRKYLLASLDQSLRRMGLDYVDIFYSHRRDPETPMEETLGALDTAVRQGKALYAGISSYSAERTTQAADDPARARHAAAHPPAVVLDAQPLDRARAARRPRRRGHRLHRLLAARPGHAHRPLSGRHPGRFASEPRRARSRPICSASRRSRRSARSTRSRGLAGRRSRRWRWPGRCAIRA